MTYQPNQYAAFRNEQGRVTFTAICYGRPDHEDHSQFLMVGTLAEVEAFCDRENEGNPEPLLDLNDYV